MYSQPDLVASAGATIQSLRRARRNVTDYKFSMGTTLYRTIKLLITFKQILKLIHSFTI